MVTSGRSFDCVYRKLITVVNVESINVLIGGTHIVNVCCGSVRFEWMNVNGSTDHDEVTSHM